MEYYEEEEEPERDDDDNESHNTDDEPEPDNIFVQEDIRRLIVSYYETEHWTDRQWFIQREELRYCWYHQHLRRFRRRGHVRNHPHIIPFDGNDYADVRFALVRQERPRRLLDRTIRRHRVREGILELDVNRTIQTGANRLPRYTHNVPNLNVPLDPAEIALRRMDARGFPRDGNIGQHIFTRWMHIGWYPMQQLIYTCPDVVMTYFLRQRPMERDHAHWQLWRVCYDILRDEEMFPPRERLWRYLDYELSTTEDEENPYESDSDDTLS
jgi:hypothetical protein